MFTLHIVFTYRRSVFLQNSEIIVCNIGTFQLLLDFVYGVISVAQPQRAEATHFQRQLLEDIWM